MRTIAPTFLLACASLFAQSPDLVQTGTLTNLITTSTPVWVASGASNGITAWRATYFVDGTNITAASVAIQGTSAPTQAACLASSSFNTITTVYSSVIEGSNPTASGAQGNVAVKSYYPCIRLSASTTGTGGTVSYQLAGYRGLFAFAQGVQNPRSTPDLVQTGTLSDSTTTSTPVWSTTGAIAWRLTYFVDGTAITAASLQIEGTNAPTLAACLAASSWTTITSTDNTIVESQNPSPSGAQGNVAVKIFYPCMRVKVNTATGTGGTIPYQLAGYRGVFTFNALLPQCSATLTTNCTPEVNGSGSYVPPIPTSGALTYYLTNTASDISTYLALTTGPYTPKTTLSTASLAAGTVTLKNWATAVGAPGLTFLPAGLYTFHIHAAQTGGSRSMTLQCVFVEVDAAGADIATIGTSEASVALGGSEAEYTLVFVDGNVYNLTSAASRIVARVQAIGGATGSNATVALYYGTTADSHISLPAAGGGGSGTPAAEAVFNTTGGTCTPSGSASACSASDTCGVGSAPCVAITHSLGRAVSPSAWDTTNATTWQMLGGTSAGSSVTNVAGTTTVTTITLSAATTSGHAYVTSANNMGPTGATGAAGAVGPQGASGVGSTRAACFDFGTDNAASDLVDADFGPQGQILKIPVAVTVIEVSAFSNAGTPSIPIIQKYSRSTGSWVATDITSAALATGTAETCAATGAACLSGEAKSGTVTIVTGASENVLAAGDWLQTKTGSGFASAGAKRVSVCAIYTLN